MKVLVTGAKGQLASDVVQLFSHFHDVYAFGRGELDITNRAQTRESICSVTPDVVVHTAAYTAVDKAEGNRKQAFLVNSTGSRNVALAATEADAKLCAISTDYVFDGEAASPYTEDAKTNPRNVYGASKLAGEDAIRESMKRYFIVRTSWVFGLHGNNFVKTMLSLGKSKGRVTVVDDQFGNPTYTKDLAEFLLRLVESDQFGVYHATNTGSCSWYDFAKEIFTQARLPVALRRCSSKEFPQPAHRPKYSVLAHTALLDNKFQDLPPWRDALHRFLKDLQTQPTSEGHK